MNLTYTQHVTKIQTLATLALAQAMLWRRQAQPIAHLRRTQASVSNMRAETGNPPGTGRNFMAETCMTMQPVRKWAVLQVLRCY